MLDQAELMQVKKYLIDILPEVLREEPEIATVIEEVLAKKFVRRDELTRLLNQLTAYRKESTQRFDRLDTRVDRLESKFDKRFDKLDTRANDLESRLQAHRIETRERFDQVDQRFEQVDQRFEQVDQRFDQVDAKLNDHGRRLERLEGFSLDAKRRLFKLEAGQERIIRRLDQQEQWLKLMIGQLGTEKGHTLEDMMAIALAYGLKNPQITPESIRLRQTLIDQEGLVFKRGFKTEVDLIAFDDSLTVFSVFEVKASLKSSDVDIFSLKIELVAAQNPDKKVHGVIIALTGHSKARERCKEYGIELLS